MGTFESIILFKYVYSILILNKFNNREGNYLFKQYIYYFYVNV